MAEHRFCKAETAVRFCLGPPIVTFAVLGKDCLSKDADLALNTNVGFHTGYFNNYNQTTKIYICTFCGMPTLFFEGRQYPGPLLGRSIQKLPADIEQVYREMRDANKNSSFTAVSLLGRKLIMHLAVSVAGAKEGKKFIHYVEHLKKSGYIPPNGDKILQYTKNLGNEKKSRN